MPFNLLNLLVCCNLYFLQFRFVIKLWIMCVIMPIKYLC